jgi:hypothetical protein
MRAFALWLVAGCWAAAHANGGAVALDAGGGADEPPVTAAELRVFMRQTTDTLAAHGAALAAHGAALADLAESTITPAVAARVEACARSTAIFAVVVLAGARFRQCSAVPLPADALGRGAAAAAGAESSFFLSSAHCFFNQTTGLLDARDMDLYVGGATHSCVLWAHFFAAAADALDLAVISCSQPVPVPPTRVSAAPFEPHSLAVLLGHSQGLHADDGERVSVTALNATHIYAPHVRFTRLVASMQLPLGSGSAGSTAATSAPRGFTEDGLFSPLPFEAAAASSGFVGHSPAHGMSGGAVVDTRCGIFGVTESSSVFAQGGQFVRLTPAVIVRVAAAVVGNRSV